MSAAQRSYLDSDATTRQQHVDSRSIGGSSGDVAKVQETGGALDFGSSSTGTVFDKVSATDTFSGEIACDGFESVIVRVETEHSAPTVKVRPWWKCASGSWTPGDVVTIGTTNKKGGTGSVPASLVSNYYHAEILQLATRGAAAVKFQLTTISAGKVSAWADAR